MVFLSEFNAFRQKYYNQYRLVVTNNIKISQITTDKSCWNRAYTFAMQSAITSENFLYIDLL